jgi:hypothetical protein
MSGCGTDPVPFSLLGTTALFSAIVSRKTSGTFLAAADAVQLGIKADFDPK